MDEDWRNAFGNLMCTGICDGAGAGIYHGAPSTCSSKDFHIPSEHTTLNNINSTY